MPTYHYVCPKCDHDFEVFTQRISESRKTKKCPACGGRARRQISGGAGFLFKGEGFYVTDYRSEEYRSRAKDEGPSKKKDEGASKEKEEGTSKEKPKEAEKTDGTSSGSKPDTGSKPKESNES